MIKTTIAGDDLTHALAKQQRYFRQHVGGALETLQDFKYAQARKTETLRRENTELKERLRMAKASLRSETR